VIRGIRGAITVDADDRHEILSATKRLLREMAERNGVKTEEIASILFSLTPDLRAAFPALGARELGWVQVPMLHFSEIDVSGAMDHVIRVLMHVNTGRSQGEIEHVYLERAVSLRPDLARE